MKKRGFSLLETLIATGVLIVVVLAVISLSNSLIAGTVANADRTIINRWNAEGLELVKKIRDDNITSRAFDQSTGLPSWFAQALEDGGRDYGWYKLRTANSKTWELDGPIPAGLTIDSSTFKDLGESLTSDKTEGYRLICVEAVGATALADTTNTFQCNTDTNGTVDDGLRSELGVCQVGNGKYDLYCQMTRSSVNRNRLVESSLIPAGNAVKIRSVIIWFDKDLVRSSSLATFVTNWRDYVQQ